MKNLQRGFAIPIIIVVIALLAIGGGTYIYTTNEIKAPTTSDLPEIISNVPDTDIVNNNTNQKPPVTSQPTPGTQPKDEPIACTMDAMQCPDGSYVGRTGPNCEFVCPVSDIDVPPPLGNSTLQIVCNSQSCNTSGVNSTRSDFYIENNGKQVRVLIDIETRLRYVASDYENGVLTKSEILKKWAEFYPLLSPRQTVGMPYSFTATIYGDWSDSDAFKANWIKWETMGY